MQEQTETETKEAELIEQHINDNKHRFNTVVYKGDCWDLNHLDPFAFFIKIDKDKQNERKILILVLFSCHCFTHSIKKDGRLEIPDDEMYHGTNENRILNKERYNLSKSLLIDMIRNLDGRHITIADKNRNFITVEKIEKDGSISFYAVFFEVEKRKHRIGHIILRIQSAYLMENLTRKQKEAKKVNLSVLIKAAYEERKIKP